MIEKLAPDGRRCFGYGVNGNGQAECYWPNCACERQAAPQPQPQPQASSEDVERVERWLSAMDIPTSEAWQRIHADYERMGVVK